MNTDSRVQHFEHHLRLNLTACCCTAASRTMSVISVSRLLGLNTDIHHLRWTCSSFYALWSSLLWKNKWLPSSDDDSGIMIIKYSYLHQTSQLTAISYSQRDKHAKHVNYIIKMDCFIHSDTLTDSKTRVSECVWMYVCMYYWSAIVSV